MLPHPPYGDSQLRIELADYDENHVFLPGQVIRGYVKRQDPVDPLYTVLDIALHGRSKVKLTELESSTAVESRRSEVILLLDGDTEQKLNDGPVDTTRTTTTEGGSPSEQSWEWELRIPEYCDPTATDAQLKDDEYFISLVQPGVPLPPSFMHRNKTPFMSVVGWVEYFMQASLIDRQNNVRVALLPIKIGHTPCFHTAAEAFPRKRSRLYGLVISHQLSTGAEEHAMLLFAQQHVGQARGTSAAPRFGFVLLLDTPPFLQPGNANPIQITLWPCLDEHRCSEVMWHNIQTMCVEGFKLKIKEHGHMLAEREGRGCQHRSITNVDVFEYRRPPELCEGDPRLWTSQCPGPAVHLGRMLNILIPSHPDLRPTWTTYNILIGHELCWELTVSIAGEKIKFSGSHFVVVKGPPEPEGTTHSGPPPPFEEDKFIQYFEALTVEGENVGSAGDAMSDG